MLEGFRRSWRENKNLRLGVLAAVLVGGALFVWTGILLVIRSQRLIQSAATPTPLTIIEPAIEESIQPDIPEMIDRRIDGTLVEETDVNRQPIGVMIENAAFAGVRPQFGLSQAQLVYEIIVEGGITRLMAVYASADLPKTIGPVRSARPTFLEFISEVNGLYAHAGGSPDALQAIDGLRIKDLSALGSDARFFYRDSARVAPHNLFTSNSLFTLALRDKNLTDTRPEYDSWTYKDDSPIQPAPTEERFVKIDFGSGEDYLVRWVYDTTANAYQRYNGGELQKDANTDTVLSFKNVIVQIVPPAVPAGEKGRINFAVTGEGDVFIVRDGEVIKGRWKKPDRLSRTQFYTVDGSLIELNRGSTWVEILPETGSIDYN